jgi:hypothetical protein
MKKPLEIQDEIRDYVSMANRIVKAELPTYYNFYLPICAITSMLITEDRNNSHYEKKLYLKELKLALQSGEPT